MAKLIRQIRSFFTFLANLYSLIAELEGEAECQAEIKAISDRLSRLERIQAQSANITLGDK